LNFATRAEYIFIYCRLSCHFVLRTAYEAMVFSAFTSRPTSLLATIKTLVKVKVKNQLDATKYAVLLPQHASNTNMPFISSTRATSSEQFSLQASQRYTTQAAFQVCPPKSGSYLFIVLLMIGILVPETC
jgi:hypothetical protein